MVGEALWLRPGMFTFLLGDSCVGLKLPVGKKKKKKKSGVNAVAFPPQPSTHSLGKKKSVHRFQRKLFFLFLCSQRNIKWTRLSKYLPSQGYSPIVLQLI